MSVASSIPRLPLLALGLLSLLGGVLAGLARLAWDVPAMAQAAAGWHGVLMIAAFFGTVISLERAVALGIGWAYLAPAAAGLGGLMLLIDAPVRVAQLLGCLAAATLVAASMQVLRRQVAAFTLVLAGGALCWLVGHLVWLLGGEIVPAVPWWLAFLVLTIAGERLELTRLLVTPRHAQRLFQLIVGVILSGAALSLLQPHNGLVLFAAGLLALAAWLLRYDIARHNVRQRGLVRFIALCLLSGYVWLALAGLLGMAGGFLPGHVWRDSALHAIGIGFVFAMVFGHAPIIFPAVARVKVPYHPAMYLPLILLHVSLAVRLAGGLQADFALRQTGGLLNALALLAFIIVMLASVLSGKTRSR